jgi:hypothetical protein
MNLLSLFSRPNHARELARIGVEKRRLTVVEKAREIRRELGLPDDPRLSA